jgi:hypothetical protein
MNPPYGAFVPKVKEFVKATYPLTSNDIYAAFIDRATQLVEPEGFVGALIARTFVAQVSAQKLRTEILLKRNPLVVISGRCFAECSTRVRSDWGPVKLE